MALPSVALPAPLLERARRARKAVEVGAGAAWGTALALHGAAPGAEWWVTDVDPRVLQAPEPLRATIFDVTREAPPALAGADLVYAVRLPEELQLSCARFARAVGADLALRPLKDEWADVAPAFRRHVAWPDGWRYFPAR